MRYPGYISLFFSSILFYSCGKPTPKQEDVFKRISGNYCAEGYRLELRPDSTFFNMRVTTGALGSRPLVERCEGTYSLEFDKTKSEWAIVFKKGNKAFSFAACEGKIEIWNKEKGWISGDSTVILNEWFDQTAVEKGKCEI